MKYRYRYYIHLKFFHLYVYIQLYIHTLVCIFEMKIWIYDTRVFVYLSQVPDEFELEYYVNESCLLQTAIVSIFHDIKFSKIVRFFKESFLCTDIFFVFCNNQDLKMELLTTILTSMSWNRNSNTTDDLKIFAEIQKLKRFEQFLFRRFHDYKSKKRKSQR